MSRISELAKNLYDHRDETGDVTFVVVLERIRAHRCVLAALSEKYKAQFYGPQPDQGDIHVAGVTAAAFNEFLKFFYFDEVDLSIEHIGDVLDLAKQSLVDGLVTECINFLKQKMTIDNLCSIYRLVNSYDIKELKGSCERKIRIDTKKLLGCDDFVYCDRETLQRILKLDTLCCPEVDVFDACLSWARAACGENCTSQNLRTALGDAIYQIRFGSMTIEEFVVRHRKLEGFFTTEESNEIFYMIGKLNGFQSQKFNQTPRDQASGDQTHDLLECKRTPRPLPPTINLETTHLVHFKCNKSIQLHGFAIASVVNSVDVEIAMDYVHSDVHQIAIEKTTNETIITLVQPIDIAAHQWYWLRFKSNALRGLEIDQSYANGDIMSNDTIFTFQSSKPLISLVSRLLFTRN